MTATMGTRHPRKAAPSKAARTPSKAVEPVKAPIVAPLALPSAFAVVEAAKPFLDLGYVVAASTAESVYLRKRMGIVGRLAYRVARTLMETPASGVGSFAFRYGLAQMPSVYIALDTDGHAAIV
jgi:hypothetical protein